MPKSGPECSGYAQWAGSREPLRSALFIESSSVLVHYVFDLPRRPKLGFISAATIRPVPWPDPSARWREHGMFGTLSASRLT